MTSAILKRRNKDAALIVSVENEGTGILTLSEFDGLTERERRQVRVVAVCGSMNDAQQIARYLPDESDNVSVQFANFLGGAR